MTAEHPFQSETPVVAERPPRRQTPMKCRISLSFMILQWGENLNINFSEPPALAARRRGAAKGPGMAASARPGGGSGGTSGGGLIFSRIHTQPAEWMGGGISAALDPRYLP
jgi:hypothetical protein